MADYYTQPILSHPSNVIVRNTAPGMNLSISTFDQQTPPSPKNMDNYWEECLVCGDRPSGRHYGIVACEGCKGFFKRSIRRSLIYSCRGNGRCPIDKTHRNRCQHCRFTKCLRMGMKKEAVQCERKPLTRSLQVSSRPCISAGVNPTNSSPPRQPTPPHPLPANQMDPDKKAAYSLENENFSFKLSVPNLGISSMSTDYLYELATRLLFQTVDWARKNPIFKKMEQSDQLLLFRHSWCDVFLLGVAQCSAAAFPLSPLLAMAASHSNVKKEPGDDSPSTVDTIMMVKDLVLSFDRLELDEVEYAYLKVIVLCKADVPALSDSNFVGQCQEQAHSSLQRYLDSKKPNQKARFAKLLLRLPATRNLSPKSVESLFFSPLTQGVPMDNIIPNLMRNS